MYSAIDIANYCIWYYKNKLNTHISNLKLQKILYFLQAEFLVTTGKPLFKEKLIAWVIGAVVKEVYMKFRFYGGASIICFKDDKEKMNSCLKIKDNDKEIINNMLYELNDYSSVALTDINLHQSPWIKAYNKRQKIYYFNKNHQYTYKWINDEIDLNELKEYFMED